MQTKNGHMNMASMFIAGSLVGAGLALLLAPQSGKKTRRDLHYLAKMARNKTEKLQLEWQHGVEDMIEGASENLQSKVDRGKEWTESKIDQLHHALDSGREVIQKEVSKVLA